MTEYTKQGVRNLNHLQPKRPNFNRKDVLQGICGKDHSLALKTTREAWGDKLEIVCTSCGGVFFTDHIDKG